MRSCASPIVCEVLQICYCSLIAIQLSCYYLHILGSRCTCLDLLLHISIRRRELNCTLPETADLPSAKIFAECIISGTRQTSSLPSAAKNTLGKIMALGKQTLYRVPKKTLSKLRKNTQQIRDTRQKTATWTSVSQCVGP